MATRDEQVAVAFLLYLLVPVVLLLLWWLFGWIRRVVFKKGGDTETGGEGEP